VARFVEPPKQPKHARSSTHLSRAVAGDQSRLSSRTSIVPATHFFGDGLEDLGAAEGLRGRDDSRRTERLPPGEVDRISRKICASGPLPGGRPRRKSSSEILAHHLGRGATWKRAGRRCSRDVIARSRYRDVSTGTFDRFG